APVVQTLVTDPAGLVTLLAQHHQIRDRDGGLLLDDPALDLLLRVRLRVPLDHVHAFDEGAVLLRVHAQDAPALSLVLACDDQDRVVPSNVPRDDRHHSTSGASEMIFMNFFSRSSRATGPKTRVPTGSLASLISTAAFLSKRMYE